MKPTPSPKLSQRQIVRALSSAAVILLVVFSVAVIAHLHTGSVRDRVDDALELERQLDEVLDAVTDAETGQRGYLLTGDPDYLQPYDSAYERAMEAYHQADALFKDEPIFHNRMDTLYDFLDSKFGEMDSTVSLFEEGRRAEAITVVNSNRGERKMEQIRRLTSQLHENRLRAVDALRGEGDWLYGINTALNLICLGLLMGIIFYLYARLTPLVTELLDAIKERDAEIAQREQIEEQRTELIDNLKTKNEELDRFAYIASHDLQEPLRTVSNFVELIEEDHKDDLGEDGQTYFHFINGATDRMRQLIEQLQQYSQLGRAGQKRPVDLNKVVRDAVDNLQATIREREAKIKIHHLPMVPGYAVELTLLFQNLVANAVKFTPTERTPKLTIGCHNNEQTYQIFVRDNAMGIDEATQAKIFQMFSRVHPTGTFAGTGVGLTFCRRIVELHGGRLTLESEPGKGSTFSFTLAKNHHETTITRDLISR